MVLYLNEYIIIYFSYFIISLEPRKHKIIVHCKKNHINVCQKWPNTSQFRIHNRLVGYREINPARRFFQRASGNPQALFLDLSLTSICYSLKKIINLYVIIVRINNQIINILLYAEANFHRS